LTAVYAREGRIDVAQTLLCELFDTFESLGVALALRMFLKLAPTCLGDRPQRLLIALDDFDQVSPFTLQSITYFAKGICFHRTPLPLSCAGIAAPWPSHA
jgi:hypothetical protein